MPNQKPDMIVCQINMQLWLHNGQWKMYHDTGGGSRTRLPKFKFSVKFPTGLHVILQIQITKIKNV